MLGGIHKGCEKHGARCDRLRTVGNVLADIGFLESELVGQDDSFPVLFESLRVVPLQIVERHHECSVVQATAPFLRGGILSGDFGLGQQ